MRCSWARHDLGQQPHQHVRACDVRVMTGIDLVILPARLAPGALAELAEDVARTIALGVDVMARRRWRLGVEPQLLLEGLDRLRPPLGARPGEILRRGV